MANSGTLRDAFIHELRDSYDAERQQMKALKKLAKRASTPALQAAFASHRSETEQQIARLEQVFGLLDEKVRGKHCEGMAGIIAEGKSVMDEGFDAPTMDACLVAAGQRAEHYEMAVYGTLVAWAHRLAQPEIAALLQQNLDEEHAADRRLSDVAETDVNTPAAATPQIDGPGKKRAAGLKGAPKKKRR